MLSLSLKTAAPFRLLAWPRYDDPADLAALVGRYASVFADQPGTCLCLLHTAEDPPAEQAATSLQAVADQLLGPEASVEILLVNDEVAPERWPEFGALVQAVAFLPSSSSGSRAQFVQAVGATVVRDRAALDELFAQAPPAALASASSMPATLRAADGSVHTVDLCDSGPLQVLTLELTSKCNLRCVYCPKCDASSDQVGGRDMDMPLASVKKAAALAEALAPEMVVLDGTGETTTLPDWMDRCRAFDRGDKPMFNLNTNFARVLSDDEIAFLAGFELVQVSIDTADEVLLRETRRKVDLQTIVYNLVRLRAAALEQGQPAPKLTVFCTLTNQNVGKLHELAALCVSLGVNSLHLNDLFELASTRRAGLCSVRSSSDEDLASFRAEVEKVKAFASAKRLEFTFSPTLAALLWDVRKASRAHSAGLTRMCLQPWQSYFVAADEGVFPCCVSMEKVGQLDDFEKAGEPDGVRAFRKRLLVGDTPQPCVNCTNARLCDPRTLQASVAQVLFKAGQAQPEKNAG